MRQIKLFKIEIDYLKYIMVVALCAMLCACNDNPTEVGAEFLQDTIRVSAIAGQEKEIIPNAYNYIVTPSAERNTGTILVGIAGDKKAGALIRFNIPVSTGITEDRIESCQIYIIPSTYAIGDTMNNILNFELKEVTAEWFQDKTTPDDVLNNKSLFAGGRDIAQFNGTINRTDSLKDTIIFDFPKDLIAKWLKNIGDGVNITDTIWGIAMLPMAGSNIINSFKSFSNESAIAGTFIKLKYWDSTHTTLDSTNIVTAEETTFATTDDKLADDDIVIQGGARVHSRLNFDISQVPAFASVNLAELVLSVDESKSVLGNKPFPQFVALRLFTDTNNNGEKIVSGQSQVVIIGNYDSTNKTFVFRDYLNQPLSKFIRSDGGKGTLAITYYTKDNEYNQLDRIVFFGLNAADVSKRPKFTFVYSAE